MELQAYDVIHDTQESGGAWVDFFAVAFGAGAVLLVLHLLGVLSMLQQWAALG